MARASAFVDAGLPGAHHPRALARRRFRSDRSSLGRIASFAVLVGFSSATQDIAIDAWRIEVAETSKQGAMAAAYQWGYRVAIIVAGAVPLLLADVVRLERLLRGDGGADGDRRRAVLAAPREQRHRLRPIQTEGIEPAPAREAIEWIVRLVLLLAGALVLGSGLAANAGVLAACARRAGRHGAARRRPGRLAVGCARVWVQLAAVLCRLRHHHPSPRCRSPAHARGPGAYLASALGDPLRDFFSRYRAAGGLILALICLYRIPDFVLNIMNPFYLDLGYSLVEIAEVRKIFGVVHDHARSVRRWPGGGALRR